LACLGSQYSAKEDMLHNLELRFSLEHIVIESGNSQS